MHFLAVFAILQTQAATISGSVTAFESRQPVSKAQVEFRIAEIPVSRVVTDPAGKFSATVPGGEIEIRVIHEDYALLVDRETLGAEEEIELRLRLRPPAGATVTVVAEQETPAVNRTVITIDELNSVPGTFGDPVRAIQALPGVARPNFAEGSLVVRGAEGVNTGYYLDGMPVPYMFHTLVGRSVMAPGFIDDIEFFPGGMPSNYGEVTQAALNVRTDTQEVGATRASVAVDFLDGSFSLEHQVTPTLTLRTAGRYSWISTFISLGSGISIMRAGGSRKEASYLSVHYHDLFGDLRWRPNSQDHFSLMAIHSRDRLAYHEGWYDSDGDGELDAPEVNADLPYDPNNWVDTSFARVRARWDHKEEAHNHSTWIAIGPEQQQNLLGAWWLSREGPYRGRVKGLTTVLRRDDSWKLGDHGVLGGLQFTHRPVTALDFSDVLDNPDRSATSTTDNQSRFSIWIEPQFRIGDWYIGAGSRTAAYWWGGTDSLQYEPRLSLRKAISEYWKAKAAIGHYSQMPSIERYAQGIGNPELPETTAWQISAGAEGTLPSGVVFDGSIYGGWMQNLVVRDLQYELYNSGDLVYSELVPNFRPVEGIAFGIEAILRVQPGQRRWWGWMTMTLGRALRIDRETSERFPSDYDQPFSLGAVAAYDLGDRKCISMNLRGLIFKREKSQNPCRWEASGRAQFTSGQPYTPIYGVYDPFYEYFHQLRGNINSERYPNYFRLDLRVERTRSARRVDWTTYLDVYNATWRKNPIMAVYNYDYSELTTLAHIPILPSLGVEAQF